ncbi:MAG: hypothetical protein ABL962_01000 [Fimbriimonadaceae bacterium]
MNFNMPCRLWLVLVAVLLAPSASANGAMGLGLEMFDLTYWFAYVGVTVILEAWLIGRYLGVGAAKSLVFSLLANTITGVFCGGLGCIAPFLHQAIIGSTANPRPFPNAVALLTLFAIPSAIIEKVVWERVQPKEKYWKSYVHIIMVHLITIPVGLGILLIPERPYKGLEAFSVSGDRREMRAATKALMSHRAEHNRLPNSAIPREILRELMPYSELLSESSWYETDFSRFGMGPDWNKPYAINQALVGKKFSERDSYPEESFVWYVKHKTLWGTVFGIEVEPSSGQIREFNGQ